MNKQDLPAGAGPVDGQVRHLAEALRQAEYLEAQFAPADISGAANELRRLHALRIELQTQVEDLKAERNRARLSGELEATRRERERCISLLERGIDLAGLHTRPDFQKYTADLLMACARLIRAAQLNEEEPNENRNA